MRRRLIVMRHAKSDWPSGVDDHERPLAGRGRREAALAGELAARACRRPSAWSLCSSATRARQTWKRVAKRLDRRARAARPTTGSTARPTGSCATCCATLPDATRTVLVIGHNPGLEDLVDMLTGVQSPLKTSLDRGAVQPVRLGRGRGAVGPPGQHGHSAVLADSPPSRSNTRIEPGAVAAQVSGRPASTRRSTSSTAQSGSVSTPASAPSRAASRTGRQRVDADAPVAARAWCWAAWTAGG